MDYDTIPARHPGMVQPVVTSTPCNPLLVKAQPKAVRHVSPYVCTGWNTLAYEIDRQPDCVGSNTPSVLEDNRMWLLMYGKRLYTIVPKRAFKDAEEVARFSSLIVRHICPATNKNAADDV